MRHLLQVTAVALAGLTGFAGAAAVDGVRLGLGNPVSVVRETLHLPVPEGVSALRLPALPSTADPSSLQVRFPDAVVDLQGWRVLGPRAARFTWRGDTAVWQPAAQPADAPPRVEIDVRSPLSVTTAVELTYLTTGLTWSARYTVQVRGDISNEEEKVALDLSARVRVENRTGRAFRSARILLVGEDAPPAEAPAAEAGFLMLDDQPLADLWLDAVPAARPRFSYLLPEAVTLPAPGVVDVRWLDTPRRPADRLYRLAAEDEARSAPGGAHALNRWLVMSHGAVGEVTALPAGAAEVQMGAQRSATVRDAWIPHTAAGGQLRIDLGPVAEVTGERQFRGRTGKVGDTFEETRAVQLANRLGSPIQVEVEERPPTELEWELLRSTAPHERSGRRLSFTTRVPAQSTLEIRYTLRIREPAF